MPIYLPSQNRRRFLVTLSTGLLTCNTPVFGREEDKVAADLVYLLNDTHIGEQHPPASPVPSHLRQIVDQLCTLEHKPVCVLINGDLALKDGQPGDYRHLARLLAPLHAAEIDVHLTLGNHDHREVFYSVFAAERPASPPVQSRHISIVETRFANFFLLDSLQATMVTQGTLGDQQLHWLARALDERPDKPALVVAHHNPRLGGDPLHFPGGLIDSAELWELLSARRQVKAYIHGHIHDRGYAEHQGIHIINTPATSYVADPTKSTTGWTTAQLTPDGATLTTHANDQQHPWNGETQSLQWRRGEA